MGLFSRKTKIEERQFFPYVDSVFSSGVFSAETNPTVDQVVSLISNTISTLPLQLFVHTKNGSQHAWSHRVSRLLEDPAVEESPTLFYKTLVRHLLLSGNAYVFKHISNGEVLSLELIDPNRVNVRRNERGMKVFNISGQRGGAFTEREVIHIVCPEEGYNGTIGRSPADVHKAVIRKNNILSEYISLFFENGMNSRLLVSLGEDFKVGSPKMPMLVQEFNQYFSKFVLGQHNVGKPIITPPSTKIEMLEMGSNVQSDIRALYADSCAEVCRIFNCPAELIDSTKSKYNSLEQKQQDFLKVCIQPLCSHIAQSLAKSLLDGSELGLYFLQFNYVSMLETDQNRKLEFYQKAFHSGIMTLSEVRNALNLKTIDDDEANNTLMVPANLIPFNKDTIEASMAKQKQIAQGFGEEQNIKNEHNPSGDDKS